MNHHCYYSQTCWEHECLLTSAILPLGHCELYGDPHYISFQGVAFDFLEECTYILVEERSPRHHLTIAVDNFYCVPGLQGSCAKGIILKYQNNIATLDINPYLFAVQVGYNTFFPIDLWYVKLPYLLIYLLFGFIL